MQYLLGIDLGTSSCKTVLFSHKLGLVSSASVEYPTYFPHQGWAEQPAEQWWDALLQTVSTVLQESSINPSDIAGIGVDSQGSTALPVDRRGRALRPGLIWMDRRSEPQCLWINANLGEALWQINGNYNDPSNIAPKLLWLKTNEPEVYRQTYKFLHANGYLVYKLTGKFSMDISEGGLTQLFDTIKGSWSEDLVKLCGLDLAKLPDVYNCFDVVGGITKEAAHLTGLREGTLVVAGAMDMVASALGSGVCSPNQVYAAAGTVTAVGVATDEPSFNQNLHLYHHIVPGLWIKAAGVDFGGGGLRWFKHLVHEKDYTAFNELASQSKPGSNGLVYLPYMVGQRAPLWNSTTRGVIMGLHPAVSKADMVRMFMEGNAFGVRQILEIATADGYVSESIRMTGGCINSPVWSQIFADITGKRIEIPRAIDVAALGSAITAAVGVGMFREFSDAFANDTLNQTFKVDYCNSDLYGKVFQVFKQIYGNLQQEFSLLAEIYGEHDDIKPRKE